MSRFFENIDTDELRNSAKEVLDFTEGKARDAYGRALDKYNGLDDELKKAIKIGVCVFGIILLVAGCFYLLGKKAGRRERCEFEYEEWDG
ncbi:hypothetical protein [Butyrivibrio sp. NC2002]|uniref:hypothetical protein n=1 Tax=Butyrivibrio sp. NC2002 TaxID=1410610 RepID=UPI00055D92B2|nr:hypothetical protein [Butyrivibrio sp. NC2002]